LILFSIFIRQKWRPILIGLEASVATRFRGFAVMRLRVMNPTGVKQS
jgi:hypothetical protein